MNKIIIVLITLLTSSVFAQTIKFRIKNDTISNKLSFTTLTNKELKTLYVKSDNFDADADFEEGYYFINKNGKNLLIYLKRSDELTISFDAENFYNSIVFTGKGARINTYLLNRQLDFIDKKGRKQKFRNKSFYNVEENQYLNDLDKFYKNLYGDIFTSGYKQTFVNEEIKNLQYAYMLELLKYKDAKKHYKIKDTVEVSTNFYEPLNHVEYDESELVKRYSSYKELAVLKWRQDIQKAKSYKAMQELLNSIRTESIKLGVLQSLYEEMISKNLDTRKYYNLIKSNSDDFILLAAAKKKYDVIRQVKAEKNLSRFTFIDSYGAEVSLTKHIGNYIFLSIWFLKCESCSETLVELEKLKKKYEGEKIKFVSISIDKEKRINDWIKVVHKNNLENDHWLFSGTKSTFLQAYKVTNLPTYVVLSLKGEVDKKIENPLSRETRVYLNKLLKKTKE